MKNLLPGLLLLAALAFTLVPSSVSAHQSGCHRWHSCPSDTGSYTCGDLGYTSGCPVKVAPKATPVTIKRVVAPAAAKETWPKVTPAVSKTVWVNGYYRANGTYVKGYWRSK